MSSNKLGKLLPFTLSESNIQQHVTFYFMLLSQHRKEHILDIMLNTGEKRFPYDTTGCAKHWLSRPHLHPRTIMILTCCIIRKVVLPTVQTFTAYLYRQQLEQALILEPGLVNCKCVQFIHDNVKLRATRVSRDTIRRLG